MAVEAQHLHLFPSQLINNIEFMNSIENQASFYNTQMAFAPQLSGPGSFIPFYTTQPSDSSSLTFNNLSTATALPRKRSRDSDHPLSFLGGDDNISSHMIQYQQQLEIDQLIAHHAEKVRTELSERRKRFTMQITAAVEQGMSEMLKTKEEEIEKMGKLNWALEERVKELCVENQIWRDLAQNKEAAANLLRSNLEQVLAAQQIKIEEENKSEMLEDCESCCDSKEEVKRHKEIIDRKMVCRNCHEREPSVLLLPCRHLCVCRTCGPVIHACPICNCSKNGIFNVNLS